MGLFSGLMRGLKNAADNGYFAAAQAALDGDTSESLQLFRAAQAARARQAAAAQAGTADAGDTFKNAISAASKLGASGLHDPLIAKSAYLPTDGAKHGDHAPKYGLVDLEPEQGTAPYGLADLGPRAWEAIRWGVDPDPDWERRRALARRNPV